MKLTKTLIDNTTPTAKDVFLWCSEVPGFGVRIAPSGRKTYIVRYRNRQRRGRMYTLGRVCDLSPSQARDRARMLFADVAGGKDPAKDKSAASTAITLNDLWERYRTQYSAHYKKQSSQDTDVRKYEGYIRKALGHMPVTEITDEDVAALHVKLHRIPYTANRVLALLSHMFTMAHKWKLRPGLPHPVKGLERYPERQRETVLAPDQLGRLFQVLDSGTVMPSFVLLVRLLLLTGCRVNEICRARVEWIDWGRNLLLLPDSKTGQRRIPLSQSAMDLLQDVREQEWVIKGRKPGTYMRSPQSSWSRLRAKVGMKGVRLHDLRHTVGSMAHKAGLTQREIAKLLGHKQLVTTERYLHGFNGDDVRAVELVASALVMQHEKNMQKHAG